MAELTADDLSLLDRAATLLRSTVTHFPSYSSGRWRITVEGEVLSVRMPYPGHVEGQVLAPIATPLCAGTKRAAEELLAGLRTDAAEALDRVRLKT